MFNGCGVMCVFRDGTYCAALFLTSQRILGTLIKVNRLPFISEVVQHFKNYSNINFHQGMINACKVMAIFHNSDLFFCFITSERNLSILVKVNRLPFISDICSACPKLLEYKFSSRSDQCS